MSAQITRTLDLKGLSCPLPIVKTAQAIRDLQSGDLIEALATDPGRSPTSMLGARRPATSWWSGARRTRCTGS